MKKISVIIPLYNAQNYIESTINSILSQKEKLQEIIIIDDGSTDNSANIIKENYASESKIKYFYQPNSGAPTARNLGIAQAKGDYVIFLDADDTLTPNTLNTYQTILEKQNNIDLIIGNYNKISEEGTLISKEKIFTTEETVFSSDIFEYANIDPKPGNKLYSLSLIKKHHLKFDDVKIGQDLNFFLKYLLFVEKMYLTAQEVFNYRVVNGSISRTYTLKILNIKETFNYIRDFYQKNNKSNYYDKYISSIEMINYYYQYCKVRYFKDKQERKKILSFFKQNTKRIKLNKKTKLFKKIHKTYIKFIFRLMIGNIFISKPYCSYIMKKNGGNHQ